MPRVSSLVITPCLLAALACELSSASTPSAPFAPPATVAEPLLVEPGEIVRLERFWDTTTVLRTLADIREQSRSELAPDVAAGLANLLDDPRRDEGDGEEFERGELRFAYVQTLNELGDAKTSSILLRTLAQDQDKQPKAIHKSAIVGLTRFAPASDEVIDALLTVQFRIPDAPGTQSIRERAARALAALGDAAVPRTLQVLRLEHDAVNELAARNGIDGKLIRMLAIKILGAIGSPVATPSLADYLPSEDCGKKKSQRPKPDDLDLALVYVRAVVARALGEIGDPRAVPKLCSCRDATGNPGDLWEIAMALGRIGGHQATQCLAKIVSTGDYLGVEKKWRYEIRWEGARWLILAASPEHVPGIRQLMAKERDKTTRENMVKWEVGLQTMESCADDVACYAKIVSDPGANWFAREVAATQLSRGARGDEEAALTIARAFEVRDPGARVTMALLTRRALDGAACPECAEALLQVLDAAQGQATAEMQSAWMTARLVAAQVSRTK